jgi:hypothetical protein
VHWRTTGERPAVAVWTAQTAQFLDNSREHPLYPLFHLVTLLGLRQLMVDFDKRKGVGRSGIDSSPDRDTRLIPPPVSSSSCELSTSSSLTMRAATPMFLQLGRYSNPHHRRQEATTHIQTHAAHHRTLRTSHQDHKR